jgi:hypothetical protein
MSERFHIGDVLSITTERLVSLSHIDGVYRILNYLTQDNLFTHQLPRAMRECQPWLLRWHPELADVKVPSFTDKASVLAWLGEQAARFGEWFDLEPIPQDDHTQRDPIAELVEMVGPEKVIVVQTDDA